MVLHLRAPKGKVSVEGMLNRAKYFDRTGKVNDHTIYLSGNLGKNALEFAMCLSAKATGGRVYTMGHTLVIEEADEAVLYFDADSTFRSAKEEVAAWEPRVQDVLAEKITEKLERAMVQSREHKIILLPALPKAWDHGEVKGLRLVGNASIALAWENGKLTRCAVTADQAYEGEVVYGEMRQAVKLEKVRQLFWMRYCSCLNHKHEDRKCRAEKNLSGVFSICKDYKAMEEKEASSVSSR